MGNGLHLDSVASVVRVEVARLAPNELLVVKMPPGTQADIIDAINAACADSAFHGRVLVIAADAELVVVEPAAQSIDLSKARVRTFPPT